MTTLPNTVDLPATLCEHDQWICWDERATGKDGKPRKVPIQPGSSRFASTTNPDTWASFDTARESTLEGPATGLGFVFTDDDPFVGVDLDDARDPETGEPEPWAQSIIETLDSYTEVSPSGTGYHVLITGELPPGRNRRGNVECYDTARFFTVTGDHVETTPETIQERRTELFEVYGEHVDDEFEDIEVDGDASSPDAEPTRDVDADVTEAQNRDGSRSTSTLADEELLSRARTADNGEKFSQLFDGHTWGYESHSEADMALACLLAFWTGGDTTQMDRLFRQSGLLREKWDEVHYGDGQTYGEKTLSRAVRVTDESYAPHETQESSPSTPTDEKSPQDDLSPEPKPAERSAHQIPLTDRERDRIETIKTLERQLRELEAENERLREERTALEATIDSDADRIDETQAGQGGILSRLKQWFS